MSLVLLHYKFVENESVVHILCVKLCLITPLCSSLFFRGFIEALSHFKKPLAAVVNGPALGLGMTILNHMDMIIASEKATFCMPYSVLGYMPEGGATLTLPQAVGTTVVCIQLLTVILLISTES